MIDSTTEVKEPMQDETTPAAGEGVDFAERYSEVIGKVNETLDKVDWSQAGRIGKATGVLLAVIVAQILIKGVLDTINLLPIVPGLLELLGLVVVGTLELEQPHHRREARGGDGEAPGTAQGISELSADSPSLGPLAGRGQQAIDAGLTLVPVGAAEQVGVVEQVIEVVEGDAPAVIRRQGPFVRRSR